MNFFEAQHHARRQSRRLVVLFALAVVAIVVAIDAVVFFVAAARAGVDADRSPAAFSGLLTLTSLAVVGVIGLASLFRVGALRAGGGAVAQSLGGTLVPAETTNRHHRRLRNVVEEIAIASGVPVPDIYVLEHEAGINAFAAGYSPSDAAVAVTQGALEKLRRDELQGVIAHEFSHILNGDMRLNIRLMGLLFGILMLGLIGRKILEGMRHSRDSKGTAPVFLVALGVMVIGYIGVFFGRWIKAGVSRSREYLADASAVQFTRQTVGLAGALKKVAGLPEGSRIDNPEVEEVSHMLFGSGMALSSMFATHPPIVERIRRLDPSFKPEQLGAVAREWSRPVDVLSLDAELGLDAVGRATNSRVGAVPPPLPDVRQDIAVQPRAVAGQVGTPKQDDFATADVIHQRIPPLLHEAARAQRSADRVIYALLLNAPGAARDRQLGLIRTRHGDHAVAETELFRQSVEALHPMQRLPLAAIAFPALRRHPRQWLDGFVQLIDELIAADGDVALFEFCLARLVSVQVIEALQPARTQVIGRSKLAQCEADVARLFAVLAVAGHDDDASARRGFQAGMQQLYGARAVAMPVADDWRDRLRESLDTLNRLNATGKQLLIEAMVMAISHDGRVAVSEAELLRVTCAALHCPLPPMLAR